jgi:hypothetical protein
VVARGWGERNGEKLFSGLESQFKEMKAVLKAEGDNGCTTMKCYRCHRI